MRVCVCVCVCVCLPFAVATMYRELMLTGCVLAFDLGDVYSYVSYDRRKQTVTVCKTIMVLQ